MPVEIRELVIKVTVAESNKDATLEQIETEVARLKRLFEEDIQKLRAAIRNKERHYR